MHMRIHSAITKLNRLPRLGCYFLVILFSDVMTMHFFFLVWLLYSSNKTMLSHWSSVPDTKFHLHFVS